MRPRIALCPKCHASMTPGERFCRNCGAVICPNCQELLPQRSRYCPKCGFLCLNEPVRETPPAVVSPSTPKQAVSGSQAFSPPKPQRPAGTMGAGAGGDRTACPQCGSAIDLDSGRCTGCGLLFGVKHRTVQTGVGPAPVSQRHAPSPQYVSGPHGAATMPSAMPAGSAGVAHAGHGRLPTAYPPGPARQVPVAPAAVGAGGAGTVGRLSAPAAPREYGHSFRGATAEAATPSDLRQTLLKLTFALFVLFILLFAGTVLYYLFSQQGGEVPAISGPSSSPPSGASTPPPSTVSPPVISDVVVTSFTDRTAVISWRTDKPATSQVRYGKTDACGLATGEVKSLVTEHSVRLTGLEADTTYYFRVISKVNGAKAEVDGEPFTTKAAIPVGTNVGNRAPDFTLKTIKGGSITLSELQGNKVLLNFWATWCEPCKKEMPFIQGVHDAWGQKGVVVLAVAVKENQWVEGVKEYIKDNNYTFTVLFDDEKKVAGLYQVTTIPVTVFIDADGIVRKVHVGEFTNQQDIENILTSF